MTVPAAAYWGFRFGVLRLGIRASGEKLSAAAGEGATPDQKKSVVKKK